MGAAGRKYVGVCVLLGSAGRTAGVLMQPSENAAVLREIWQETNQQAWVLVIVLSLTCSVTLEREPLRIREPLLPHL